MASTTVGDPVEARGQRRRLRLRHLRAPTLFVLPGILILLLIRVLPLAEAVWLSFTSWDGFNEPEFVGLANYVEVVSDPGFLASLANNGILLLFLPVWILGPLVLAVMLQSRIRGWRVMRMAYFFPAVLSPVVVGLYYSVLLRFDGPLNDILDALGLTSERVAWLTESSTALPVTIAIIIWAGFGVGVLLYMAALGNVNLELYDAAQVDGATGWKMHWHITLPQLLPVIEFYTVIVIVSVFTVLFPYIYTLTRGGPGYRTMVLDYYVYTTAFTDGRFGYASAIGTLLLLLLVAVVGLVVAAFRRRAA